MEALLNAGHSVKEIANQLHVHQATIYREYNRGKYMHRNSDYTEEERYSSDLGQQAHDWYITGKGRPLKIKNDIKYIEKLEKKILDEKYFGEICKKQDIKPEDSIMIGNDVDEDLCSAKLGFDTYLITDTIVNRDNKDYSDYKNGSFEEFYKDFLKGD